MKRLKSKRWKFAETQDYVDVYVNTKGDIYCIYPKPPKWAANVAEKIWRDAETNGMPTKKGLKDCVRGQWGMYIAEAARKARKS